MTDGLKSWAQLKIDAQARRIVELASIAWIVIKRVDNEKDERGFFKRGEEVAIRWYLRQRDAEAEVTRLRAEAGDMIAQDARQQGKKAKQQVVYMFREATYGFAREADLNAAIEMAEIMIEEWCERRERLLSLQAEYAKDPG